MCINCYNKYLMCDMIGGVDYQSGPYSVMIPTGLMSALLNIPITDDNILERNESFDLCISRLMPPSQVMDDASKATVTIVDDDGKNK